MSVMIFQLLIFLNPFVRLFVVVCGLFVCCCFVGRGVVQGWEDALVSKCALLSVTDLWYLL